MSEPDDAALVRAIAAGDRPSLGRLYDRHASVLLGLGIRILRDRAEAEDVLHDVFLEVWQRAHSYERGRGPVRTWLLLRMRSRCLDRVRAARVKKRDPMPEGDIGSVPPAEVGDQHRLPQMLAALNDDQRNVVVLGFYRGLSASEIAEALAVPVGTVKSRLAAALKHLRRGIGVGGAP
ncbi:MAG: sigma-70 family RNA polymerase sigma factor [Sandaracinaceae bacterium]